MEVKANGIQNLQIDSLSLFDNKGTSSVVPNHQALSSCGHLYCTTL